MTYLQAKAIKKEMNDKLNILEAKLKEFQVAGWSEKYKNLVYNYLYNKGYINS